jgi:hypothetical protein
MLRRNVLGVIVAVLAYAAGGPEFTRVAATAARLS